MENQYYQKKDYCSCCCPSNQEKATITLMAIPTVITTSETSNLSGEVRVNGRLAKGIIVIFSVDDETLGEVRPFITTTDNSGQFKSTFFPNKDIQGIKLVFVTAALPSFPGITATSVIAIGRGQE